MRFEDIAVSPLSAESLNRAFVPILAALTAARTDLELDAAVTAWDAERRRVYTAGALISLRFAQDTRDPDRKAAQESWDALRPVLLGHELDAKRVLIAPPFRDRIAERFGEALLRRWACDVTSFDPILADHLVAESSVGHDYVELLASAEIEFGGETCNLPALRRFFESPDRDERRGAQAACWSWFGERGETLDRLFGELVRIRHEMAVALGYPNYVDLGYRRMSRIDYGDDDVARFRSAVRRDIVPLASALRARQAGSLGVGRLELWDEPVFRLEGNPQPLGDAAWVSREAADLFAAVCPEVGGFYSELESGSFLDLHARPGKTGGGFCTAFPSHGYPYVFANFNSTRSDVRVLLHEVGHAFQVWRSRHKTLVDLQWPTLESAEIHSMTLEHLAHPHMDRMFGPQAEEFRRVHLTESLLLLPYAVAVDEFQHRVYEAPEATPAERKEMWRDLEHTYLPWRGYGDLPYVGDGAFWQRQRHIYVRPFYYIDYALAQTCALHFWLRSLRDPAQTVRDYVALCDRGGESSFKELLKSAGLPSPFDSDCFVDIIERASAILLD